MSLLWLLPPCGGDSRARYNKPLRLDAAGADALGGRGREAAAAAHVRACSKRPRASPAPPFPGPRPPGRLRPGQRPSTNCRAFPPRCSCESCARPPRRGGRICNSSLERTVGAAAGGAWAVAKLEGAAQGGARALGPSVEARPENERKGQEAGIQPRHASAPCKFHHKGCVGARAGCGGEGMVPKRPPGWRARNDMLARAHACAGALHLSGCHGLGGPRGRLARARRARGHRLFFVSWDAPVLQPHRATGQHRTGRHARLRVRGRARAFHHWRPVQINAPTKPTTASTTSSQITHPYSIDRKVNKVRRPAATRAPPAPVAACRRAGPPLPQASVRMCMCVYVSVPCAWGGSRLPWRAG
jgi:hypothetical protein